ncbi:transposase IS1634 family protein [Tolypothrix tenuis PCC 7101]|uniref:Transposase IS1634 family protein n=1 Tax=Tolypothrix tenuis PCC 7101 TaxID=231146 RepID=A0A1Z4MTG7_9CYAN|nr:transposase IS1634 family protein [Tolypothrix tenuis PCC 7101]BAZ71741.1 transposase IS1634 family protein [Aulosira laxa NIES-50]BAY97752.1 transposase IS1634 family protein [Tolypothrix tenuis PCC 7101]BAZ02267.1 transposase IS1634 family protein [Tolypothrix tenuis PCC 7101]BAZ72736.1 transposase IS1634 family protein [Aulosira laxa NIES-50]
MYIERVPNRNSPPAVLLRESYREGNKVRKRTLANLSKLPDSAVNGLQVLLKGGVAIESLPSAFKIIRSRPHGHVAAVLGSLKNIGLHNLISEENTRERRLVLAMIVARIIDPRSKLATARGLSDETCFSSIGEILRLEGADEDELYQAMDWLLDKQETIENNLAAKHLAEGTLVLYDVSSSYFEGKTCPLAQYGYNRDGKRGKLQIVFGLLCSQEGCPIAIEVFSGNTADPKTFTLQIKKLRDRFGIKQVIWVGDRGIITSTSIKEDLKTAGSVDWISALRSTQIRSLVEQDSIQLSLFDEHNLAEISSDDYPGERLIACRNPILAADRAKTREELLQATQKELDKIVVATTREKRRLKGESNIGLKVGQVLNRYKVGKHFSVDIQADSFSYERNAQSIEREAALDGLYVIRTSVKPEVLGAKETVKTYKSLSQVEQAFRSFKTVDLKIRPIYHHTSQRVKAHVFLCMLAYYVEWHMREVLSPILFDEDDWESAELKQISVVCAAQSDKTLAKAQTKRTEDNLPVHSFQTLLADLGTIVKNQIQSTLQGASDIIFDKITEPTQLQQKALDLLGVSLICTQ